jgi:outer membrane protein TolC
MSACRWLSMATLACLGMLGACSRQQYHAAADREVTGLVAEKAGDPRWAVPLFDVEMDPRSRFYEPYNQDKPPMPEDDPAAHQLMHYLDGKRGYPYWHKFGDRPELENPWWRAYLGDYAEVTSEGKVKLSLESAVDLGRINSPAYQENLEDVYLSALDVSTERFRFDVQFLQSFSGNDTTFTHLGRKRAQPFGSDILSTDTDLQMRRRFATAGELLVGFANSIVWQFAGPNTYTTVSILGFNFVQPLLRAGGRAVALEQLTIVERALLGNLRAFQRYRQGFFTRLAIGDETVQGPQRRGGFFGGTGLTGFTGTGAGGLGGVGEATGFGRGNFAGTGGGGGSAAGFAGGGAGTVGGFVGLLQVLQEIRNSEENLRVQLRTRDLLEEFYNAGDIRRGQVDQFRQSLETERANLLQARNNLANLLDVYKGALGLPPDMEFELDDSMIRQFQFIDPRMTSMEERLGRFQEALGQLPEDPGLPELRQALVEAAKLREAVGQLPELVQKDLDRWRSREGAAKDKLALEDLASARDSMAGARKTLAAADARLAAIRDGLSPETRKRSYSELVRWTRELLQVIQDLSLVQARSRLEGVENVAEVNLTSEEAIRIARANRLDWMNNRAALVDTWRLIEFNANALKSDLSLVFNGDIRTTDDKPFRFRGPAGSLQVGVQFDGPFNRLLERNNYRQALIDYQRDRRQLVTFEDNVYRTLRTLLRRLEQLRENLEIQRRAGALAVRRVDEMFERLNEPPQPGVPRQLPPVFDLLTALSDLRNTQNNLMSVWLNYYAARMLLYRDLGIMELDDRGNWIDRPLDEYRCEGCDSWPLPPEVPEQWIVEANQPGAKQPVPEPPMFRAPPVPGPTGPALSAPNGSLPARIPDVEAPAPTEPRAKESGLPTDHTAARPNPNRQAATAPLRSWTVSD